MDRENSDCEAYFCIILGKPTGYDEIWVIGDTHMLSLIRSALDELRDNDNFINTGSRQRLPFILENFEVYFGTYHHSWSFTTQIKGGLKDLLSTKWKLPNYIYIVLSNDQIEDSEILGDLLYDVLNATFMDVSRLLTERKVILPKRARRFKPPAVCIVRTVPKSEMKQNTNNFKNKRRTLNRALQQVAADFKWRTVNVDTIRPKVDSHFDEKGDELSTQGLRLFWEFISEDLKGWDSGTPPKTPINNPIIGREHKDIYKHY